MKFLSAIGTVLLIASQGFAAGDAGCGLGSLIIKDNTKLMQLFAVTTNGSFGSQTFGITFGTSNCTAKGIALKEKEQEYYTEVNFETLQKEMAQGQGEHLNAYAVLLGCDAKDLSEVTQKNFSEIVTKETKATEMLGNVKRILKQERKTCSFVS